MPNITISDAFVFGAVCNRLERAIEAQELLREAYVKGVLSLPTPPGRTDNPPAARDLLAVRDFVKDKLLPTLPAAPSPALLLGPLRPAEPRRRIAQDAAHSQQRPVLAQLGRR